MIALLSDPSEVARRHAMRRAHHLAGFAPFLADLRARHGEVPDPDPLDGGTGARLLLLLETPGPKIRASGIVSRDNATGTGRNLRALLDGAGLARRDTLIWNAVPWVIHPEGALNRAPNRAELRAGIAELPAFLALLPNLRVAILAGRSAAHAADTIAELRPGLQVLQMAHPSPTIQCTSPAIREGCRATLAAAAAVLAEPARVGEAA